MGLAGWLVECVAPAFHTVGRAAGPLICAPIYSYWVCDEASAEAGESEVGPVTRSGDPSSAPQTV